MCVSYSKEMIIRPQLATMVWGDTVGLRSRTNHTGTISCRLRIDILLWVLLWILLLQTREVHQLGRNPLFRLYR